jgi:formylglycine-generating enzyme required for sulfatase activity
MKTPNIINYMTLLAWFLPVGGTLPAAPPDTAGARPQPSTGVSEETANVTIENRLGEMIAIPAGSFMMGNNGREGFGGPEEFPQHLVDLPAYQIGKYEVTRGQFRKFIDAGGYEDARYWSIDGWQWKESDVIDYAGMHGRVTRVKRPNANEKRREPEHWAAEQEWIGQPLWVHGYGRECLGVGCRLEQVVPG